MTILRSSCFAFVKKAFVHQRQNCLLKGRRFDFRVHLVEGIQRNLDILVLHFEKELLYFVLADIHVVLYNLSIKKFTPFRRPW
jgi:hypothetical protein